MKVMKCLIIDDEPLAIDVIENYLSRIRDVEISRSQNPLDAMQLMKQVKFDLLFLDIQMPLLTGFEFLRTIKDPPMVIITTAFREYAVESFEFEVLDYLVKPVSFPTFMRALERALKKFDTQEPEETIQDSSSLFLKVDRKLIKIMTDDILYVESLKDYIKVITKKEQYISYQSLTSITEKLPASKFKRIHRSFTVNIDKITRMDGSNVMINGVAIPVSRDLKQDLVQLLKGEG
ncbi:MAG: response regulator transcription factor [Chitinophagaceae bacterium]|nr:MAG: response regulator transcription factor [Chitinophagaceae bacterium]